MTPLIALVLRDWRVIRTYRVAFVTQFAGIVFSLVSIRFLASFVGDSGRLADYGGDYFSFAMLGLAVGVLAFPVTRAFADAVRDAQVTGMLEAMLTTQASPVTVVLGAGLYRIVIAATQAVLLVVVASLLFGAQLNPSSALLALVVLLLGIASFAGIGLLSASFTLWSQQREPISAAVLGASSLLSGVLYPVDVLPAPLRWASDLLPMTHVLEVARHVLIEGAGGGGLAFHAGALAVFGLLLPLGVIAVRLSVRQARRSGSLAHY